MVPSWILPGPMTCKTIQAHMLRENLVQKLCSLTYVPLRYGGGLVELDRVFHGLKETGGVRTQSEPIASVGLEHAPPQWSDFGSLQLPWQ